jgi:hypothetical protein
MLELPEPEQGGDISELRQFLNVSDEDFVLQVGFLLGVLRPRGPYPVDILTGPSDSAKSTGCMVLAQLVDPNFAHFISFKSSDDTYVAAYSRHLLAFDNVSRIDAEHSDVIAKLSTGTGYAKRKLRTDAEQFMMRAFRPILMNGIPDDLAERSDVATRTIVSELQALDDSDQQGEEEFWERFEVCRPRILGALLNGVAGALRDAHKIDLRGHGRIRMKDLVRWAEAGCRALGFKEGEFLDAFVVNQGRAMRLAFQNDLVAQGIAMLMNEIPEGTLVLGNGKVTTGHSHLGIWRGNTRPLLKAVEKAVRKAKEYGMLDEKRWPQNDVWFGRNLRRSATVLRKAKGIKITFKVNLRQIKEGDKDGVEIQRVEKEAGEHGEHGE